MFDIVKKAVSLLGFPQILSGEFTGSGEGTLTSSANITALTEANLSANATITAGIYSDIEASAFLSATLTLEVSTTIVQAASSLVAGDSDLTAQCSLIFLSNSGLYFDSNLESNAHIVHITTSRPLSGQSNLVATMFQPLNILVLPTVEYQYSDDRLMKFYGIDSGQSLIITGTTGTIVEFQTGTEIDAADYYYGGGRRHVLNDTEVTAVTNAGFGELITIEGVPSGV